MSPCPAAPSFRPIPTRRWTRSSGVTAPSSSPKLGTVTDPADALGWLVSKRTVGDTVTVFRREAPIDWLAEQVGVAEPAPRPAPAGWLPVVVQTDSHIALRWLAIPASEEAEDAPPVTKAVVVA